MPCMKGISSSSCVLLTAPLTVTTACGGWDRAELHPTPFCGRETVPQRLGQPRQLKLLPLQEHLEDGLWLVWRDGAHSRDKGGARELADPPQVAAAICEVADGALTRAERSLRGRFRRHRGAKQRLQLWVDEPAPRERGTYACL